MIEIERKFLVNSNDYKNKAHKSIKIAQGYLSKDPERTVRIRICDDRGFITIKGISSEDGLSRYEWEKEIPFKEAKELLSICLPTIIEKSRFEVYYKNILFEVDEFYGKHEGLIVAEVELESTQEKVELPDWIGKEVTGNKNYYNAVLSNSE
ncbi:MAG: CYTH domain-containing protein [Flavobacteriaceae bacterium]